MAAMLKSDGLRDNGFARIGCLLATACAMAIASSAHALVASVSSGRDLREVLPVADPGPSQDEMELAQSKTKPIIVTLYPNKGPIGTVVVIDGKNFTPERNVIEFRGEKGFAAGSSVGVGSEFGTRLQFRVSPCPVAQPQCPVRFVPPGVYRVSVINTSGESNAVEFLLTDH